MSLVEFLIQYCGVALAERRGEDTEDLATLVACLLVFPDGRRLILIERTYRDGMDTRPSDWWSCRLPSALKA